MKRITIKRNDRFNRLYPKYLPARVSVTLADGTKHTREVIQPKGYAGRPMSKDDVRRKFEYLAQPIMSEDRRRRLMLVLFSLDRLSQLKSLINMTHVGF
jgi:2-methylcitrate dehydratase